MNWSFLVIGFLCGQIIPTVFYFVRYLMADMVEVGQAWPENQKNGASWWWRIKSRNGQIVATSETYDSAGNARKMGKKKAKAYGLKYVDHTKGDKQ